VKQITITKPDDWHLHLRNGLEMSSVVGMTAKQMGRAIIMPNLSPPVRTSEEALKYREEIMPERKSCGRFPTIQILVP